MAATKALGLGADVGGRRDGADDGAAMGRAPAWFPAVGAVVGALDVSALRIGPEIDPGVPWTASVADKPLLLALKSGNFGAPDFFTKAFTQL